MRKIKKTVFLSFVLLILGCDGKTETPKTASVKGSPPSKQSALTTKTSTHSIPEPCGDGGLALKDVVAVNGSYEVRTAPNVKAPRLKNEKASRILGGEHYHVIDNSTTVRRLCAQADWTEIQIQTPEWLTHVKGWVPNKALREIERNETGQRVYVDSDFSWGKDTSKYKRQIVSVVNKISRENPNCSEIDTASVAKSSSRGTSKDPVFFVTCGSGVNAFNVWFRPKDADGQKTFQAKQPLAKSAATDTCEMAAKQAAVHPSTVQFSRVWDLAYIPHVSGRARVVSTFTAKNSLNLELRYRIDCLFDGPTLIETSIAEATVN